ncbi:MAG: hypothetical protein HYW63_04495 [Candidatus Levybacteria bacterium]|nr:hypothetical protein [Candidatus Levybacteria bacterium]
MIRLETESLIQAQRRSGLRVEAGDPLIRRRRLHIAPGMIGSFSITLPSRIEIYKGTYQEVNGQVNELTSRFGQELRAIGAVWGRPLALRLGNGLEPALTIRAGTSEEQRQRIRDIVGFPIPLLEVPQLISYR